MKRSLWTAPAFWVALGLLSVSAVALPIALSQFKLHLRKKQITVDLKLPSIPSETPNWERVGVDQQMSKEVIEELGTSNYVSRSYRLIPQRNGSSAAGGSGAGGSSASSADSGQPIVVELHLAYYTGMIDTVPHVPDRCLVGGGWSIARTNSSVPVPLNMDRMSVDVDASRDVGATVHRARMTNGSHIRMPVGIEDLRLNVSQFTYPGSDRTLTAGYFFIANGGVTASAAGVRLLAFDGTSEYAYYLKVQVSSTSTDTPEALAEHAAKLLDEMLPDVMQCVPDWVEVRRGNYPPEAVKALDSAGAASN
jgi:Protein of unknown function (DUF3485)